MWPQTGTKRPLRCVVVIRAPSFSLLRPFPSYFKVVRTFKSGWKRGHRNASTISVSTTRPALSHRGPPAPTPEWQRGRAARGRRGVRRPCGRGHWDLPFSAASGTDFLWSQNWIPGLPGEPCLWAADFSFVRCLRLWKKQVCPQGLALSLDEDSQSSIPGSKSCPWQTSVAFATSLCLPLLSFDPGSGVLCYSCLLFFFFGNSFIEIIHIQYGLPILNVQFNVFCIFI